MSAFAILRKLGNRRTADAMDARCTEYRPEATASRTVMFSGIVGVWNVRATPTRATLSGDDCETTVSPIVITPASAV